MYAILKSGNRQHSYSCVITRLIISLCLKFSIAREDRWGWFIMKHAQRGETLIYSLLVITQQTLRLDASCCNLATTFRFTLERLQGLWKTILLQKLVVAQLVNKFHDFYGTRRSINVFAGTKRYP
jgi:hypothetical protein